MRLLHPPPLCKILKSVTADRYHLLPMPQTTTGLAHILSFDKHLLSVNPGPGPVPSTVMSQNGRRLHSIVLPVC